jgi:hypothetical protein
MVPIIAFTHYEIRDFSSNCAELTRGLPAASPPSLLLASASKPGEGIGLPRGSASPTGPSVGEIFLQCGELGVPADHEIPPPRARADSRLASRFALVWENTLNYVWQTRLKFL